ncbi:MAG: NAD(P)/FAD-dependent oxidoreductase [Ktedonobacterales bacterium]|nr:NAD(P)/FAD-dependent oxidoreductase [Ktedonobacterales bacterium]
MGAITAELVRCAEERGVTLRTATPVRRVVIADGVAVGVELADGTVAPHDIVISNADPVTTCRYLIGDHPLMADYQAVLASYDPATWYAPTKIALALDRLPAFAIDEPLAQQHIGGLFICPSPAAQAAAFAAAKAGRLPNPNMIALMTPTTTDPTLAPPGKHLMCLYVRCTPLTCDGAPWDASNEHFLYEDALDQLSAYLPDLRACIRAQHLISPTTLQREYGLATGEIMHLPLETPWLFDQRPVPGYSDYTTPIAQLFLCGAGTHPGGTVTGAPGHNCAQRIIAEFA